MQEEEDLLYEWQPIPLVPSAVGQKPKEMPILNSACDSHVVLSNGHNCINMASSNFFGFANHPEIKRECERTIHKYGVGSCGPRGFYGTFDVHLALEKQVAKFYGVADSILYSDGFATACSAIPAFAKKDDVLVCDEGVNCAIQTGATLSRARVVSFKHNDVADLRRVLQSVTPKLGPGSRKFIVVEGLYQNFGDVAPLGEILKLKEEFKYRLIVDDSMSLGVLGKSGHGIAEHCDVPIEKVDILFASLDSAIASTGGFCIGNAPEVVEHQRLSGLGYCFSASAPPYTSMASSCAFTLIQAHWKVLLEKLRARSHRMRQGLAGTAGVTMEGPSFSPVIHIRFSSPRNRDFAAIEKAFNSTRDHTARDKALASIRADDAAEAQLLYNFQKWLAEKSGVLVAISEYTMQETRPPRPSMKIMLSVNHDDKDIEQTIQAVKWVFQNMAKGRM